MTNQSQIVARIFQITDLHLLGDTNKNFLGINPYQHFVSVIEDAAQYKKPDIHNLLLLTGDISQDFSLASYELAISVAKRLNIPQKTIAGNHDDKNTLTKIMQKNDAEKQMSQAYNDWHIILLDSHWPNHVEGLLAPQELTFLQHELNNNRSKHIIVFLHHHVIPVGTAWVDKFSLTNSEELLALLALHQNVQAVFSGHIHQESTSQHRHMAFYTTPAVAWQFVPKIATFKLDTQMPGYRIIDLYNDGKYTTKVIRLAHNEAFIPDVHSSGY